MTRLRRNMASYGLKGGIPACKTWPFTASKAAFRALKGRLLQIGQRWMKTVSKSPLNITDCKYLP